MLVSHEEYSLEGAFKVDTYDRSGNMVNTTDWFSNFITNTGLLYPTVFSFANCFRFLSIGENGTAWNEAGNDVPSNATTALVQPMATFKVQPPPEAADPTPLWQATQYIGYEGYETGIDGEFSACGTRVNNTGVIFYRAWSFPTGGCTIITPQTIGELGVSPSGVGAEVGSSLFSRVRRTLYLDVGYRTVISYQLRVNMQSQKLTHLPANTFSTANASEVDTDLTKEWGLLSGFYKQTWMGLSCIDSFGASFITKFGNGMEPYITNFSNYVLYFSPDNAAFDVNPLRGGAGLSANMAWASDGTMTPIGHSDRGTSLLYTSPLDETMLNRLGSQEEKAKLYLGPEEIRSNIPTESTDVTVQIPYNIRLGSDDLALRTPRLSDYKKDVVYTTSDKFTYQGSNGRFVDSSAQEISYATPGGTGLLPARDPLFGQRAIFANKMFRLPLDTTNFPQNTYNRRKKTVTRKAIFSPAASLGCNTRFGSMVFGFRNPSEEDNVTFYPTIDTLFYDNSGIALQQHYRRISGIYFTCRGSGIDQAYVSIPGADITVNAKRFDGTVKTVQGPLAAGQTGIMTGGLAATIPASHLCSGALNPAKSIHGDLSMNAGYGYGAIYGFGGPDWDVDGVDAKPQDFGIAYHHTGALYDNPTGQLYWPNWHGNKIQVSFFPISFKGSPLKATLTDDGSYTHDQIVGWGYIRPTGYLVSWDAIGGEGNRLLPHYAAGKDYLGEGESDLYPSITGGGTYPAMSLDNGVEMYFHVTWSSPCGSDTNNCVEPV